MSIGKKDIDDLYWIYLTKRKMKSQDIGLKNTDSQICSCESCLKKAGKYKILANLGLSIYILFEEKNVFTAYK